MEDIESPAGRKASKARKRKADRPNGRRDARSTGSEGVQAGRRRRRQISLDAETACRLDVHCRGEMPQFDPTDETNRILLAYLRQHGRKRKYLDADYARPDPVNPQAGQDDGTTSAGQDRQDDAIA